MGQGTSYAVSNSLGTDTFNKNVTLFCDRVKIGEAQKILEGPTEKTLFSII